MKGMLKTPSLGVLSQREREVLRLAADGCTDLSICRHLGIAPGTLGTYWTRVRNKTGLSSRTELAAAYVRHRCEGVLVKTVALVAEQSIKPAGRGGGLLAGTGSFELFDAIPIAALVVKSEGEIVAMNDLAVRLIGQRPRPGSNLKRHLSAQDLPSVVHMLRSTQSTLGSARFQARVITTSGTRDCNWLAKPLHARSRLIVLLISESEVSVRVPVMSRF